MHASKLKVAVLGYGYWGPNMVRNFHAHADVEIAAVCDMRWLRREHLERHHPTLNMANDWRVVVRDPGVDAVVVCTPVSTHYEIAREALKEGKHVLVEKPLALSSPDARELVDLAEGKSLVLMVGHTFVYHGAVRYMRELIAAGELGELLYLDSTRANLGILQEDINVIWDLAPHDVSMMDFLMDQRPRVVNATGSSHTERGLEEVAFLTFQFDDGLIGHINVNWLSPVKIRTLLLGGTRKMVHFDDKEPSEKIRVYDRGLNRAFSQEKRHNELIQYRAGDVYIPSLDLTEALKAEARDFVSSIRNRHKPQADGVSGLRVVRLLEYACRSLALGGVPVAIEEDRV